MSISLENKKYFISFYVSVDFLVAIAIVEDE